MKIYVTDEHGNREEITDLYWFEENGVHDFSGESWIGTSKYGYEFEIEIGDTIIGNAVVAEDAIVSVKEFKLSGCDAGEHVVREGETHCVYCGALVPAHR